MKKIISLILAVLMIATVMVACKKDGNGTESSTPVDSIPDAPDASSSDTGADGESNPDADIDTNIVFTDCNEKAYVIDVAAVNLRSAPSYDDSAVATSVDFGTELQRIGKHDEWSKVVYNNTEYFVVTKYLSGDNPNITFEDKDEVVYATYEDSDFVQLRTFPSLADAAKADSLPVGTELKRTGIAYDKENDPEGLGWSRVEYEGETYYMRNSTLTTEKPTAPETTPEA